MFDLSAIERLGISRAVAEAKLAEGTNVLVIAEQFDTVRDYKAPREAERRARIAEGIRRRFTERYIPPVSEGPSRHGFTMMAISCRMIEAFVSLRNGWNDSKERGRHLFFL